MQHLRGDSVKAVKEEPPFGKFSTQLSIQFPSSQFHSMSLLLITLQFLMTFNQRSGKI